MTRQNLDFKPGRNLSMRPRTGSPLGLLLGIVPGAGLILSLGLAPLALALAITAPVPPIRRSLASETAPELVTSKMEPTIESLMPTPETLPPPSLERAGQDDEPMPRPIQPTISVSGTGRVSAAPDLADINLGVVTQASTAKDALAANTTAMTALQNVLKERGVAAKDVQTSQISVQPQYSQPPQPRPNTPQQPEYIPRIVAYQVVNSVKVTSRDLAKLGTILDAVVTAGANRIEGISFRVDKYEKLQEQARKAAMDDAKRKAELLAGEAGVVVGTPLTISEVGPSIPSPMPHFGGRMMAMAADAAPVPVSAGEQELSVTVHVVYKLQVPK